MSTPTSAAAEIERLAQQGATPGELLGMLPTPSLRTTLHTLEQALDYSLVTDDDDVDRVAAALVIIQAELDTRH